MGNNFTFMLALTIVPILTSATKVVSANLISNADGLALGVLISAIVTIAALTCVAEVSADLVHLDDGLPGLLFLFFLLLLGGGLILLFLLLLFNNNYFTLVLAFTIISLLASTTEVVSAHLIGDADGLSFSVLEFAVVLEAASALVAEVLANFVHLDNRLSGLALLLFLILFSSFRGGISGGFVGRGGLDFTFMPAKTGISKLALATEVVAADLFFNGLVSLIISTMGEAAAVAMLTFTVVTEVEALSDLTRGRGDGFSFAVGILARISMAATAVVAKGAAHLFELFFC